MTISKPILAYFALLFFWLGIGAGKFMPDIALTTVMFAALLTAVVVAITVIMDGLQ